ncbi:phage tail protein [Pseudoalteromonas sp. MMG024]|uniref:phage tail-collar fiber domain-containing protein n=1 Tax=Pseudoalteromonas sp. MMG024 TaxID=2909980 RepID=UPI001F24CBE2|nr:phage tail protein [Pseudoalteromonas sp. MMG024]MCF6459040.1 phage tail protein [Pseudoalteromonas sp. MMG024]
MSDYFTVLTNAGAAAIAATQPGGTLNISQMAIGTGGANYNPTVAAMRTQTQLIDEVKRYPIVTLGPAIEENAYFIQGIVPIQDGGWTIKEVGWFLDDGTLFAVSKYPPVEKTLPNSGAGIEIPIKATFKITSDVNLAIVVDNSAVYVTREEFLAHNHDGRYALKEHVLTPVPVNAKFTDTHRAITDSLTSTSSSTSASANAMRITHSVAKSAQEKANRALLINPVTDTGGSLLQHTKTGIYRIYNAETDLPPGYIANASDFVVTVKGLDGIPSTSVDPTYCKVTAQDVRSSVEWFNTRIAGVWQGWETNSEHHVFLTDGGEITLLPVRKTVVNAWIGSGTINIPLMPKGYEVEVVIHHKGSGIRINTAVGVWLYKDKYNGLSDVVREKGTLIFQSLGDHFRARGIKSK